MKKIKFFYLFIIFGFNTFASNTIVAIVDDIPITLNSIQNDLLTANSNEEIFEILNYTNSYYFGLKFILLTIWIMSVLKKLSKLLVYIGETEL